MPLTLSEAREFEALRADVNGLKRFRSEYQPKIDNLIESDKIEAAVKSAISKRDHVYFTIPQKLAGVLLTGLAIVDFLRPYLHHG